MWFGRARTPSAASCGAVAGRPWEWDWWDERAVWAGGDVAQKIYGAQNYNWSSGVSVCSCTRRRKRGDVARRAGAFCTNLGGPRPERHWLRGSVVLAERARTRKEATLSRVHVHMRQSKRNMKTWTRTTTNHHKQRHKHKHTARERARQENQKHAAIANGILSQSAAQQIYKIHNKLFDLNPIGEGFCWKNQITFLNLFKEYEMKHIAHICTLPQEHLNIIRFIGHGPIPHAPLNLWIKHHKLI